MPEPILLVIVLAAAGAVVLAPLRHAPERAVDGDERDAAALRHRVALEALRDVEADRRSGSLDDRAYHQQLAEAEARAAETRAALDAQPVDVGEVRPAMGRSVPIVAAILIGAVLVGGSLFEASGIANATVTNEALARAQAAESARQGRIGELLDALAGDPRSPEVLSELADEYLSGSAGDDLVRAAVALQALIELEPGRADAYERLMSAYLRAGDGRNARAVHDDYAALVAADPVEVAFFDGLIALRSEDDPEGALAAFDRFLELAPDDPRAAMIRGLREEAAADS